MLKLKLCVVIYKKYALTVDILNGFWLFTESF